MIVQELSSLGLSLRSPSALVVSTGSIRWILWFSVRYAAAGKENSILKNKMAATGISLKIIDIFLLAVSHR